MKFECKLAICLAVFFLAGCAGSSSSLKDDMQEKTLIKANSATADSLLAKTPAFAQSLFKGAIDSVPGDYYYSVAEGRIDTLYNLKDGKYERSAGIRYVDSSHYVVSRIEIRAGEMSACKVYQNENLIREYQKGKSYRLFDADSVYEIQGDVRLVNMDNDSITCIKCVSNFRLKDSEKLNSTIEAESYTGDAKNFKFVMKMDMKLEVNLNRDSVKQYNDQGVLIKDLLFPKYLRDYYDNGNLKYEWTGVLYRNDKGMIDVEDGYNKGYYENGQMMGEIEFKNKKKVLERQWNESGNLIMEIHYDSLEYAGVPFFLTAHVWNDKGLLIKDLKYPEYYREFYDDGKMKLEATGIYRNAVATTKMYIDSFDKVGAANGSMKQFYENGQMEVLVNYKDGKGYSFQSWYENGTIQAEGDVSSGSHKEYDQNGKVVRDVKGTFYYDDNGGLVLTEGNGKEWNESGILISDLKMPNSLKKYWDDGKLKEDISGILYYGNNKDILLDSGEYKSFYPNGQKESLVAYNNKVASFAKKWNDKGKLVFDQKFDNLGQVISEKSWNDKGVLVSEFEFPSSLKNYFDNGSLKDETLGVFYLDNFGQVQIKEGTYKSYYEDGSWKTVGTMKNGLLRNSQHRVMMGKEYVFELGYDSLGTIDSYKLTKDGVLDVERHGVLYENDNSADLGYGVDTGYEEIFHKNGKVKMRIEYNHKKMIGKKEWDEEKHLLVDVHIPDYYREYYVDGKLMQEAVGIIEAENGSFKVKEGVVKTYDSNGKVNYSATYKDYQIDSEKTGDF